ncbi:MAG: type II toxin-antitoxin system VapC family toxin [Pyrinomonadaceae bacterium]
MNYVVDASVVVKWYVPETFSIEAEKLLDPAYRLAAPELILPEFSNIIWKKVRRNEITQKYGSNAVKAFEKSAVSTYPHRPLLQAAYTGAILTGQTVYDWTYLCLAVHLNCELVTADEKFYKALETTKLKKHLMWIGDIK